MTAITVRITEEEKQDLKKHGEISKVVREAITNYLSATKSIETIKQLEELQKNNVTKTTTQQEINLLRKDRQR